MKKDTKKKLFDFLTDNEEDREDRYLGKYGEDDDDEEFEDSDEEDEIEEDERPRRRDSGRRDARRSDEEVSRRSMRRDPDERHEVEDREERIIREARRRAEAQERRRDEIEEPEDEYEDDEPESDSIFANKGLMIAMGGLLALIIIVVIVIAVIFLKNQNKDYDEEETPVVAASDVIDEENGSEQVGEGEGNESSDPANAQNSSETGLTGEHEGQGGSDNSSIEVILTDDQASALVSIDAGSNSTNTASQTTDTNSVQTNVDPSKMVFTDADDTVTAKNKTNLRDIPSQGEDAKIVHELANGETAHRIGISDSGWSKLEYDGQTLYAVSSYLTTDLDAKPVTTEESPFKTVFTSVNEQVTPKDVINLRNIPSVTHEDSQVIATVSNGEVFTRTGINTDVGWSRVEYNGQTLYCVSSYLTNVE